MRRLGRVLQILRSEGVSGIALRVCDRVRTKLIGRSHSRHQIRMLVRTADALAVDWTTTPPWAEQRHTVKDRPVRTAWLMHPPGESSGGHQNIFRFIKYLEDAGHEATVYLYSSADVRPVADAVRDMIRQSSSYPHVQAEFRVYDQVDADTDAIFATGWETAYPVYRDPSLARRFYFVQDFEPSFYPVGSESVLADNTYRFGFEAITAGGWLAHKLTTDYGMKAASFEFGADISLYSHENPKERRGVFFYARPVTTRRGFELGVMALELVAKARPDVEIHFAGWDVSSYDLSFDYVNHGAMRIDELNELYNQCAVGLVVSLTNMSLLPLELLAAGVIPVVNDGENNRLVTDNQFIHYSAPNPHSLAKAILEVLDNPEQAEFASQAAASVKDLSWDRPGAQFVEFLEGSIRE